MLSVLLLIGVRLAAQQTLTCGSVVHTNIGTAGQTNTFAFSANAGEVVRLTSVPIASSVQPDIYVFNPAGTYVGGFGYNDGFSTLPLTNTGTYTVQVRDRNNSHTGNYDMSLVWATPRCGTAISCGQVLTNTFTSPVQQDSYNFTGSPGGVIRLTSVSKSGGVGPDIDVFNVAGVYVGGWGYNDGFSTLALTNSGSYTVIVRDRGNDSIGTYTLGVSYATPKCAAIALSCGQVITNTFIDPAQQHTYSLAGVAGDVVRLTSVSKSGGVEPDIDVFNAAGVRVGYWGYDDGITTLTLTNSGTYTVIVRDRGNDSTGTYTLGVSYATPKCAATSLFCDHVLVGSITDPAQQQMYSLSGLAGEIVHITSTPVSGGVGPDVDVFSSHGVYVGGFGYNDTASQLTLTNTGTYTVIVRDRGNNDTGSYSLGLTVSGGCARVYVDSANARTQQVSCLLVRIFAGSPASFVGFTLHAPCGYLTNVSLNTGGRFTNAVFTPGTNCQWSVTLQTSPTNALMGDETLGSLCFTPFSPESAFVPLTISNLVVTNVDNSVPSAAASGGRVAVIANRPLLEGLLGSGRKRLLALYGKTNTTYEIREATNLAAISPWVLGWVTNVPSSLSSTSAVQGVLSNAPILFLRANEH